MKDYHNDVASAMDLTKGFDSWNNKLKIWLSPKYRERSLDIFNKIDEYLRTTDATFNNIMDIGCGIAQIPQHFQNKYGSKLFLLEGSYEDNYNFYGTLKDIDFRLDKQGLTNYELIDISNLKPVNQKMNLILSFLAVGHHFYVKDWIQWIQEHSDDNTKIILDLKKDTSWRWKSIEIVEVIEESKIMCLAEVKIK
jgi:hypothetical protein